MWNRIIFLSTVAALGIISASLCAPALPFIADHFSANFSYIQFTISLFLLGNALGQFFSGPLSDQIGQRTVLLLGLCLYVVASCGCALSPHMNLLLLCRFFQGMGSSVGPVISRAIASSTFSQDRSAQVQSYGAMGVGMASILAILSSGHITMWSWRGNFWLAACLGIALLIWTSIALKKVALPEKVKLSLNQMIKQLKEVFKNPHFLSNTICHCMTYGLMYGYITLFPFLLIDIFHERKPELVGLYSAYMIGFYLLGAYLTTRFVLKWTSKTMLTAGVILQLISGALLIIAPPMWILPALSIFNLSIGIILPVTAARALSPFVGKAVGSASSTLGLSYRFIGSILSALICQLPLLGGKNLAWSIFILSIMSLVILKTKAAKEISHMI